MAFPHSPSLPLSALVLRLRSAGCVFAEQEVDLIAATARTPCELSSMAERRCAGFPLEHVLGWAQFCGLRVAVDAGVPRPRTEFLARKAAVLLRPGAVALDLCCGSGALGAVLSATDPDLILHAADIDAAGVACARRNLPGHSVHHGDLYDPLPRELRGQVLVLVLVANVPYLSFARVPPASPGRGCQIPTHRIALLPSEARVHEARHALDGGTDGLDLVRRVSAGAREWLAPGGHLLVEVGKHQVEEAVAAFTGGGLPCRVRTCREWEATVLVGTR